MPSQLDLDQGNTVREWVNVYLGPSVGWIRAPMRNQLGITAAGTFTLDLSTNYVQVNIAGAVTIILPSALNPSVAQGVLPGLMAKVPVSIIDVGGHAAAFPITIQPASVAENIMGLTSIQITSNFGGFILYPNNGIKGWTNQS